MNPNKQKPDFVHLGERLVTWYNANSRDLPWRENRDPYRIWISEVVLQQTQVKQGLGHYLRFVERFPDVQALAAADTDEVLLYWKGLGYYSRALNLHAAAKQICEDYKGVFPHTYNEILKLKGVGRYTAAAISSICFNERIPAVDGNFYRVLSRIFADHYDVSRPAAFSYFSELALLMMPEHYAGLFNQAVMDLGSEICRPRNPLCMFCPVSSDCMAYSTGRVTDFPVKTKKLRVENLLLHYYFVQCENQFLIRRRDTRMIWKNLYEFPTDIPPEWLDFVIKSTQVAHKLTHRNLSITIDHIVLENKHQFETFAAVNEFSMVTTAESSQKSFPKPLENYIHKAGLD